MKQPRKKYHSARIYRVTLSTTPTKEIIANPYRRSLLIVNRDATLTVEIRSNPQTSGLLIEPDESYENMHYCQGDYWLVATSGSPVVHIQEDYQEHDESP